MSEQADLLFGSIADISARIRDGHLSPVELARHCLERIEALNPNLNAVITMTAQLALDQAGNAASEIRAGHWRGPLHGLPVAVKDFYDTAGIRTTAGLEHFQDRVPFQDAELVVKLRNAGAVLVGKTNMHKLGIGTTSLESHFGPVVDPWSARRVAAALPVAPRPLWPRDSVSRPIDTDAIGSGRLPAPICGVVCHKPTFSLLSTVGILAGEKADPAILLLSHPCLMERSAEDLALALHALTSSSRAGATPVRVPFEAASFDVSRGRMRSGSGQCDLVCRCRCDVLPTLAAAAPTLMRRVRGPLAVSIGNTFFANYFGLPAMTVPSGADKDGLPLGVQFVGPAGGDAQVISLAVAYQRAIGWRYVPPQVVHTNAPKQP
jgi:aspartyl-tRNA(Asn)/glutamyl-tRNA(Gln) amidotransferase subunit A